VHKIKAQQLEEMVRELQQLIPVLDSWLVDARRKLDRANNDEGQLQVRIKT